MSTSKDVARIAGVSRATVSNVINRTRYVSPQLARSVREAIAQLNYYTHGIARSLVARKTYSIGIVVARLSSSFYPSLLSAIESTISRKGYSMILLDSHEDEGVEKRNLRILAEKRVDGVLWVPCSDKNVESAQNLSRMDVPIIQVDRRIADYELDSITSDNEAAGREAVRHFLRIGCSRIAVLTFCQQHSPARERLQGYLLALEEAGIEINDEYVCIAENPEYEDAEKKVVELLKKRPRVEAIFACSDTLTIAALAGIRRIGLRIPKDVKLLGFDDSPWCDFSDPPVSVITQNTKDMGVISSTLLLQKMSKKGAGDSFETVKIPTRLIKRRSCGEQVKADK